MEQNKNYKDQAINKQVTQPEQSEPVWQFNTAWILVPLALLVMAYILKNVCSSVTWDDILDFLGVTNRAAYTRLFHLFLIITFIVAAAKIIGKKDDK